MTATPLDPGGNIHQRARLHVCMIVTHLTRRKNVPVSIDTCMEIGTGVMQGMQERDLYRLLYMQDATVEDEVIWRVNNCVDYIAAGAFVRAFARAAGLAPLADDAFGMLIDSVIDRLKGDNPVGPRTCRWPAAQEIEAMAARAVEAASPANPEELRDAILPLIRPEYLVNHPLGADDPAHDPPPSPDGERRAMKALLIDL